MDFGYRATLPGSVVMGISQRAAGAGAGIGAGLAGLGQQLTRVSYEDEQAQEAIAASEFRITQQELQRRRSEAIAIGSGDMAELGLRLTEEMQERRDNAEAGAPGHADDAASRIGEVTTGFLQQLPDDEVVRQFFMPRLERLAASATQREQDFERERRVTHIGNQLEKSVEVGSASIYANPDFGNFQQRMTDALAAIDAQEDLDGTAREALKDKVRGTYSNALLDSLVDKGGYDAAEEALETGQFDAYIGGADGRAAFGKRIAAGRDVERRQAEAAEADRRRAVLERMETVEVLLENGEAVPTSDIVALTEEAKAAGVENSTILEFGFASDRAVRAQGATKMTIPQLEAQQAALQDRVNAGDATPEDIRQLDAVDKEIGRRDTDTGQSIRELAQSGVPGQVEAATQLAKLPPDRRFAAAREAGDERLAIYAGLNPRAMAYAAQGRAVRGARPDDFLPPKEGGMASKKRLHDGVANMLGPQIVRQLGGQYDEVVDTALDIMAGTEGGWNSAGFKSAMQIVFGATRRSNGTVQGGFGVVRGRVIELPPKLTPAEFDRAMARNSFSTARYSDGSRADKADILANYTPVPTGRKQRGKLEYLFLDARNRPLLFEDGRNFVGLFGE